MSKRHSRLGAYTERGGIGFLLKRAHTLLVARIEPELAKASLTFTQWIILMCLRDKLVINATELSTHLCYDMGALTRVLDQLGTLTLIKRERGLEDRRTVKLCLTERGREVLDRLLPRVVHQLNAGLHGFSATSLAELTRLLTKLIVRLEIPPDPPALELARAKDSQRESVVDEHLAAVPSACEE